MGEVEPILMANLKNSLHFGENDYPFKGLRQDYDNLLLISWVFSGAVILKSVSLLVAER